MKKLGLKNLNLNGKRVLLRVDFNVPMDAAGQITDDSRIRAALPTIRYILDHHASVVLMSHLGRPKGKESTFSLAPCAAKLSEILQRDVQMAPDCIGPATEKMAYQLKPGELMLLENLRFYEGEEEPEKDPNFVASLAKLGDLYVNDAFGAAHRAHASTSVITKYFPEKAAAGFLMEKEITFLSSLLESPDRPFYAILGGAKVSTKVGVIHHLLKRVDTLYIGGAMAFTFLKAQGIEIGSSLAEESEVRTAAAILREARNLILPTDFVVADAFSNDAKMKVVRAEEGIEEGWQGMDIGPETVADWSQSLQEAKTIFWNGPLGVFEMPTFAKGTFAIAQTLAASKVHVTVGGGDSVCAIHQMGLSDCFSHLSTGGGASLEFLEYGYLPGIDALSNL